MNVQSSEEISQFSLLYIQQHFRVALDKLFQIDSGLIRIDANERSMTHRLALYLEPEFPGWNIDCEYNRMGEDPKRLHSQVESVSSDDLDGRTVYPDIIVHHREVDSNLLVIEAKRTSSDGKIDPKDQNKIKGYIEELGYRFGLWIAFNTTLKDAVLLWFEKVGGECRQCDTGVRP